MLRHCWVAFAAVAVVAAFTSVPATAAERATLRVTARVVDQCTFEVPPWVPPWLWRDRQHEPWRFVHHRCHGERPFWIDAKRMLLERLRDRWVSRDRDRDDARGDDRGHDRGRDREHDRGHGEDGPGDGWQSGRDGERGHAQKTRHPTRKDVVLITITY